MRLSAWAALAVIAVSWFLLVTVSSTFGPVQHLVHFYELGSVLRDPFWLVHGMGPANTFGSFAFGCLSLAVLAAPAIGHQMNCRFARLLYLLPLALMVLCGVILYAKASQPYVTVSANAGAFGAFAARVANDAIGRGVDTIAKHISVGVGGYLALLAAIYLAFTGLRSDRTGMNDENLASADSGS